HFTPPCPAKNLAFEVPVCSGLPRNITAGGSAPALAQATNTSTGAVREMCVIMGSGRRAGMPGFEKLCGPSRCGRQRITRTHPASLGWRYPVRAMLHFLALASCSGGKVPLDPGTSYRVLFIGNSLTYI